MGPVFESILTIIGPIALLIALLAYVFRHELARVKRYIQAWQKEDEVDEDLRKRAEREIEEIGPEDQEIPLRGE